MHLRLGYPVFGQMLSVGLLELVLPGVGLIHAGRMSGNRQLIHVGIEQLLLAPLLVGFAWSFVNWFSILRKRARMERYEKERFGKFDGRVGSPELDDLLSSPRHEYTRVV